MITWSDLSSTKRDLLLAVGVVNRDDDRSGLGLEVVAELRDRFGHDATREAYYMALADLSDRGLVEKRDADDPANYPQKHYELTPEGVRLVNQHRADVDDSVRVLA